MEGARDSFPEVSLRLPGWVAEHASGDHAYETVEDRMRFAVELSRQNVRRETGGPFGAAIFERASGRLLAPGVNPVVGTGCSVFHAEMVAQKVLGTFDPGGATPATPSLPRSRRPPG